MLLNWIEKIRLAIINELKVQENDGLSKELEIILMNYTEIKAQFYQILDDIEELKFNSTISGIQTQTLSHKSMYNLTSNEEISYRMMDLENCNRIYFWSIIILYRSSF